MTRKECLDAAAACVLKDRNNSYGGPEDSFGVIANFWSVYLGRKVYPHDVAMMMSLLKIARIKANRGYADGYVDLAGYAACGAECASAETARPVPFASESEGGCCQNGNNQSEAEAEPEFKPGDRVEVHAMTARDLWEPAVVVETYGKEGFYRVEYSDGYRRLVTSSLVRPAPKAEGCSSQPKAFARENHPENPDSSSEFKRGEKVEVHSPTTKVWQEATIVDVDKEHTLYRVRFPDGTVSIRPACYVRHVVKEDKPQAEGCEELVQKDAPQTSQELYKRIIANNPATYGTPHKPTGEELAEMAGEAKIMWETKYECEGNE